MVVVKTEVLSPSSLTQTTVLRGAFNEDMVLRKSSGQYPNYKQEFACGNKGEYEN